MAQSRPQFCSLYCLGLRDNTVSTRPGRHTKKREYGYTPAQRAYGFFLKSFPGGSSNLIFWISTTAITLVKLYLEGDHVSMIQMLL